MPLTLAPETEARLRSFAAERGQDPEEVLTLLVDQAITAAEVEMQEALADLRASEEDIAAGRWISLEDYQAQIQAEKQARNAQEAQLSGSR